MKTATIPPLRVDPALREAAEAVLREGESLSAFVEASLRAQIEQRRQQQAFVARGIAALERADRTGRTVPAATVLGRLERQLAKAKPRKP